MNLNIRDKKDCKFDAVSLGEVMLRFDPGEGRIRTAREFKVWEGGGEYNVIRGLRRCFGMNTAVITAFADNEVGHLVEDFILQGGVDTSLINWKKTDGIGRECRNGINFVERGFGIRGALSCSDRANTAISQATDKDFDFDYIFGELGVRWFHTGGIYAALSEQSAETVIKAIKTAKKYGTIVSYDLNYRASMWSAIGGQKKALAFVTVRDYPEQQLRSVPVNRYIPPFVQNQEILFIQIPAEAFQRSVFSGLGQLEHQFLYRKEANIVAFHAGIDSGGNRHVSLPDTDRTVKNEIVFLLNEINILQFFPG